MPAKLSNGDLSVSETINANETPNGAATKKPATVYEDVAMEDGRTVKFPGRRQLSKDILTDDEGFALAVRFDFRHGKTLTINLADLGPKVTSLLLAHGTSQKCGDEASDAKAVEDMYSAVEAMVQRLLSGEFYVERGSGDSFAGTNVVVKAIAEVKGASVDKVKAWLQKMLDDAKARGETLSRQALYKSFRKPGSPTFAVIQRLEAEDAAKESKLDANELLASLPSD